MSALLSLLTSPVAIARVLTAAIAVLFASRSGVWFPNSLFADLAVYYSAAIGMAMFAKFGGDSVFSRSLATGEKPLQVLISYLAAAYLRLALVVPIAGFLIAKLFDLGILDVFGMALLSVNMITGNALRIAISPNFQIGFDNSAFSIFVLSGVVLLGFPLEIAAIAYSLTLLACYIVRIRMLPIGKCRSTSITSFVSGYYLASELGYFAMGYSVPALLVLSNGSAEAGAIRSVEQVVFAGTLVLFLINNRLFFDLSKSQGRPIPFSDYLMKYSAPAVIFYAVAIGGIALLAKLGHLPNVAQMPLVFFLYSLAHLANVVCGPVSGYLNFLGEERFVTFSTALGAAPLLIVTPFALHLNETLSLVVGSVVGIVMTNLLLLLRLFNKTRAVGAEFE